MWSALRKILVANPMGIFIYGIFAKWYILMMVSTLVVTFWVFKGLQEIGLIDYVETTATEILGVTKAVAQNCVPKLKEGGLQGFWDCLSNPGEYKDSEKLTGEKRLEEDLEGIIKIIVPSTHDNPYDNQIETPTPNRNTEPQPATMENNSQK